MKRESFFEVLERTRQSQEYSAYLEVRERVLEMLDQFATKSDFPSDYWREELSGFDYLLDASPLIVRKLREHCYHLTGIRSYDYRIHHEYRGDAFMSKLRRLQKEDTSNLFVPESSQLGGFGYNINGALVNLDTLKYYECLIALSKAGQLQLLRRDMDSKRVVVEIGAGWGGFAYQFKTLFPKTCYVIVDLPQTLLFSGVYLKTSFPQASIRLCTDEPSVNLLDSCERYDFVLLPHYLWKDVQLSRIDLTLNMVSFQEMTTSQVETYVQKVYELNCPNVYSLNRERSPYNKQLATVSSVLAEYYDLQEIKVLDIPYTTIIHYGSRHILLDRIKSLGRKLLRSCARSSMYEYHHLVGTRRDSHN